MVMALGGGRKERTILRSLTPCNTDAFTSSVVVDDAILLKL